MALIRPIRPLPIKPTADKLRALLRRYGLTQVVAARLMRVDPHTVHCYLLPEKSKANIKIPKSRWELLLMKVQAIYHPDEAIEINL